MSEKINLFKVSSNTSPEAISEIQKVLESGYIGEGEKTKEFEQLCKDQCFEDKTNLLYVNSGTSALHLSLEYIKRFECQSKNPVVLSTTLSCFAGVVPMLISGMPIKWVDVDKNTCNIDLDDVYSKLTEDTEILTYVNWGGTPVDYKELKKLVDYYWVRYEKPLFIIEDNAHCWNNEYIDKTFVTKGTMFKCYSTQAIKFLTSVEGGLIATNNDEAYKQMKLMRWFGLDREGGSSFRCVQNIGEKTWGYKYQPNNIFAQIGINNFDKAIENTLLHRRNAEIYNQELKDLKKIKLAKTENSSYWLYTIFVDDKDKFTEYMDKAGIEVSQVHKRMDKHSCVAQYNNPKLPNTDYVDESMTCIPVGFFLSLEQIYYIIETIKNYDSIK